MYVNGVDKILGTPFNIMHPNLSIMNIKQNFHLLVKKCISFINVEFIAELLYWIKLDCTG